MRYNYIIPFILALLLLQSCTSLDPRGRATGTDYFQKDFSCKTDSLAHEKSERYLSDYQSVRSIFLADNERRKTAFSVITGDSTAMLFTQSLLSRYLEGIDVVNRGIGGDTTELLKNRIEKDVVSLKPRFVIIAIGGNDLLGGRCIPLILDNVRSIVKTVRRKLPLSQIILVSVPPVNTWKANSISPFFNRKLVYLAESDNNIMFLDLWKRLSMEDLPHLKEVYRIDTFGKGEDEVHFNEEGYRTWAEMLRPILSGKK